MNSDDNSLKNVKKFTYLGLTLTSKNHIYKEYKSTLISGNAQGQLYL